LLASPEYTFKHALTHEVAYGSLLHERRRACMSGSARAPARRPADRACGATGLPRILSRWEQNARYMRQAAREGGAPAHGEAVAPRPCPAALGHLTRPRPGWRQSTSDLNRACPRRGPPGFRSTARPNAGRRHRRSRRVYQPRAANSTTTRSARVSPD
jgi:hypothetical protein